MMKLFRNEQGQMLVMTALCMASLLGFMALALDVSLLFRAKRRVQTAADAAAIAGALEYYYNGTISTSGCGTGVGNVACASDTAALNNGISSANQVTTHIGPTQGYHLGAEYVEVIITQPNPTVFMAFFGFTPVNVGGRAVAGITPGGTCAIALNKTAADSVDVQGAAQINMPHCALQINSTNDTALCTTGGKAQIVADAIRIVGAQNPKGKCNKTQPNAQTGVNAMPDPFANLPSPTCTPGTNVSSATTITAAVAGSLPSQVQTTGSGATATNATVTCFSAANVSINSGVTLGTAGGNAIFVFQNGVTLSGTTTINGTLDIAGGQFTQGNTALTITAPADTTATYNAMALIYPSTNTTNSCDSSYKGSDSACVQVQFGSGSGNLDGMIYAPGAAVYMQDNGGGTVVTALIADMIWDKSSNLEITNNYNYVHTTSPLNQVSLVE
jgi:hypothetical protein